MIGICPMLSKNAITGNRKLAKHGSYHHVQYVYSPEVLCIFNCLIERLFCSFPSCVLLQDNTIFFVNNIPSAGLQHFSKCIGVGFLLLFYWH